MAEKLFDRIKRLGDRVFGRSDREAATPATRYVDASVQTQSGPRYTDAATQTESSPRYPRGDMDEPEPLRKKGFAPPLRLGRESDRIQPPRPSVYEHRKRALAALEGRPVNESNKGVSANVREQQTPQPFTQPPRLEQSDESKRARTAAMDVVSRRLNRLDLPNANERDQNQIAATLSKLNTMSSERSKLAGKTGTRDRNDGRA